MMSLGEAEQERKSRGLIRLGVISEANYKGSVRYRVQDGDIETDWLYPMMTRAAGDVSEWFYEVGEQVVFLHESGGDGIGVIMGAIAQDSYETYVEDPKVKRVTFANGNYAEHNRETGSLTIQASGDIFIKKGNVIVEDGSVVVKQGSVTVEKGDVTVAEGDINVPKGDVVASGVSLTKHVHEKTAPHLSAKSGKPE